MPPSRRAEKKRAGRQQPKGSTTTSTQKGVSKLMASPDVMSAVLTLLGQKEPPLAPEPAKATAPPKTKAAAHPPAKARVTAPAKPKASAPPRAKGTASARAPAPAPAPPPAPAPASAEDEFDYGPEPVISSVYRGPAPPIEQMHAAGYLGSERELKSIWAWAREHEPNGYVWPTPVEGAQEAVRFDTAGWPTASSTPTEWIQCLSFWTALREQVSPHAVRIVHASALLRLGVELLL